MTSSGVVLQLHGLHLLQTELTEPYFLGLKGAARYSKQTYGLAMVTLTPAPRRKREAYID